jgi:hypothetical protein
MPAGRPTSTTRPTLPTGHTSITCTVNSRQLEAGVGREPRAVAADERGHSQKIRPRADPEQNKAIDFSGCSASTYAKRSSGLGHLPSHAHSRVHFAPHIRHHTSSQTSPIIFFAFERVLLISEFAIIESGKHCPLLRLRSL